MELEDSIFWACYHLRC